MPGHESEDVRHLAPIDEKTKVNLSLALSMTILISLVGGGIGFGRYVAGMESMSGELRVNTVALGLNTKANTDSIGALTKLFDRMQVQQEYQQRQMEQLTEFRREDSKRLRAVEDAMLVIGTKDGMKR